jgi:hypothetical protein
MSDTLDRPSGHRFNMRRDHQREDSVKPLSDNVAFAAIRASNIPVLQKRAEAGLSLFGDDEE